MTSFSKTDSPTEARASRRTLIWPRYLSMERETFLTSWSCYFSQRIRPSASQLATEVVKLDTCGRITGEIEENKEFRMSWSWRTLVRESRGMILTDLQHTPEVRCLEASPWSAPVRWYSLFDLMSHIWCFWHEWRTKEKEVESCPDLEESQWRRKKSSHKGDDLWNVAAGKNFKMLKLLRP